MTSSEFVNYKERFMRVIKLGLCGMLVIGLGGLDASGQGGAQQTKTLGGMTLGLRAPTNNTVDWAAANMAAGFKEMVEKKLESQRILEGGAFNMNLRRETAAEPGATAHGKKADLYMIKVGEATLTTSGELIDPKPGNGTEGDLNGSGIRNGLSRVVKPGDTIFIPPGVPHQITAVNGEVQFLLFRWDTK
jgi:mannose-6-phosphate isomerase-like protein (cupin superfamily)